MPAPKDPIKYAEWIKKLSVANKKRTGEKSANYGKHFSKEWKHKLSIAQKGKPKSEETKKKMSEGLKGRTFSEEHRNNLSKALKGNPKLSIAQKGKPTSEETKKKISEARIGKYSGKQSPLYGIPKSEEHRIKISDTLKGKYIGEKSMNWRGGISFDPYCIKFNKEFKERVREFFGRRCVECNKPEEENGNKLSVHHVNYDKMMCCNDTTPLFVALCNSCHSMTQGNRDKWTQYFEELINTKYNGKCFYTKEEMNSNANPIP